MPRRFRLFWKGCVRLERGLEIEKLDDEGLPVRVFQHAAVPLASGLAQEFVRAAQQLPVLPGSVGDRREHGFSEDRGGKLVAERLEQCQLFR